MVDDSSSFLSEGTDDQEQTLLRRHERMGRPLDSKKSVRKLERALDRVLRPQKRRPPTEEREKLVWCPRDTMVSPEYSP